MIIIATYSNVSVTYTADGTQTVFSFPFDYLRKAFVLVEVNEETILTQGTDYSVSNKTVVFTTAPTAGTVLRIYRQTDTKPLVSWADASVLRAKDMTVQQIQELHILEETQEWARDYAIIRDDTKWNARNFPIKNVGDPEDLKDAANREYVDQLVAGVVAKGGNIVPFNNVSLMKTSEDLVLGMYAVTAGYYEVNDGGSSVYAIRAKTQDDVDDGGSIIVLDNGNVAELIQDGVISVKQFGAKGDGVADDTNAFRNAFLMPKLYIPSGNYKITDYVIGVNDVVCDGTFTDYTPLFSRPNLLETVNRFTPVLNGQYNLGYLGSAYVEAMTYNSKIDRIILALYKFTEPKSAVFLVVNKNDFSVEDTIEFEGIVGINTINYDPINDVYYVRTRNTEESKFYEFTGDLSSYTVIAEGLDIPYYMWAVDSASKMIYEIAYSYARKSFDVDVYDATHTNKLKSVAFTGELCKTHYWLQDVCANRGKIYIFTDLYIVELDISSGSVNKLASDSCMEMEACTFVDGQFWIAYHQPTSDGLEFFAKYTVDTTAQNYDKVNFSSVHDIIDIDLNYYKADGAYYCNSSATAGKHYPPNETKGFLINVANGRIYDTDNNYVVQKFYSLKTPYSVYRRTYSMSNRTWSDWKSDATFSENLNIRKSNPVLQLRVENFEKGVIPSGDVDCGVINFLDKNSSYLSRIWGSANATRMALNFRIQKNASSNTFRNLAFSYSNSDVVYFAPQTDNAINLGTSSYRWKEVFAGTATINTSDERVKDNIEPIPDNVLDAWGKVQWYQFQFRDAIANKGKTARIHTGMIAQRIKGVFESHGLDAFRYGLLCHDEWEAEDEVKDENGNVLQESLPAGDLYSLRYEEALCMEAAYQRRRADRLEARIEALERIIQKE